jgi:hypothetical protein
MIWLSGTGCLSLNDIWKWLCHLEFIEFFRDIAEYFVDLIVYTCTFRFRRTARPCNCRPSALRINQPKLWS